MKLICRQCKNKNKYKAIQIYNDRGFLCEHCGHYMEKTKLAYYARSILVFVLVVCPPYIGNALFYEIPSQTHRLLLGALFIMVVFLMMLPLIAFFMCYVTNHKTCRSASKNLSPSKTSSDQNTTE